VHAWLLAIALTAGFWDKVADPHRERIEILLARAQAEMADRLGSGAVEGAGRAESLLRDALKLEPEHFTATVLLGEAQARQGRGASAAAAFARARSLARTPGEESWCSLRAAIESSRAGRFTAALADYDQHIRLGQAQPSAYSNSAEILMALGRLGEAEDRYREAIRLETQTDPSPLSARERDENLALAYYGLGIALDRDEQALAAREAVAQALARDPKMALLDAARDERGEVFFVPSGDVHYYRGLSLMVLSRPREATDAFTRFLAEQRGSRFTKRAEAHLLELAAGEQPRARGRLRLAASGITYADEGLLAPLVAALKSHTGLIEGCLEDVPVTVQETVRISLDLEFDAAGAAQRVKAHGRDDLGAFVSCLDGRFKTALRLPRSPSGRVSSARLDLVLALRR
jgi:tetratricopeptide (TPR) repeat protein